MGSHVSIADLEMILDAFGEQYGIPKGLGPEDVMLEYGQKIDAPLLSTTTGVFTAVSQAMMFAGVTTQHNVFSAFPKKRHDRGAFRYITTRAKSSGGGLADGAVTPDTIKPTLVRPAVPLKLEAVHFDMGAIAQDLGSSEDDVLTWGAIQDYMAEEFTYVLENDVTEDNGTLAGNNLESVDRVAASVSEMAGNSDGAGAAYTAGDLDIYLQDRDAANPAFDAYVSHASGVDRDFTGAPFLNLLLQNVAPFWGGGGTYDNKVWMSPYSLQEALNEIEGAASRYVSQVFVRTGLNGVQTIPGQGGGFAVNAYRSIPWICSDALQSDTLGRAYLFDLDNIWIDLLRAPMTLDSGENTNYVLMQKYAREAANFMEGELFSVRFPVHAKGRDFK